MNKVTKNTLWLCIESVSPVSGDYDADFFTFGRLYYSRTDGKLIDDTNKQHGVADDFQLKHFVQIPDLSKLSEIISQYC